MLHTAAVGTLDRENAAVSRMAADMGSWIVCWQEYDNAVAADDWDVKANRVTQAGALVGSDAEMSNGKVAGHSIMPKVAGQAGRYVVTWSDATSQSAPSGLHVYGRRFDWGDSSSTPTLMSIRTLETVLNGFGVLVNSAVAYDTVTQSHWGVVLRHEHTGVVGSVRVKRLGYTAGVVEQQTAFSNDGTPLSSDITHHVFGTEDFFQVGFKANVVGNGVYCANLPYQNAGSSIYGTGCGGTLSIEAPLAGDQYYATSIAGIKANTPAALLLSGKQAALSLAAIGMTNCWLNVDLGVYVTLNTSSNMNGQVTMPLALPDSPLVVGDLYTQWVWLAPGANLLGVLSSQGVKHMIR